MIHARPRAAASGGAALARSSHVSGQRPMVARRSAIETTLELDDTPGESQVERRTQRQITAPWHSTRHHRKSIAVCESPRYVVSTQPQTESQPVAPVEECEPELQCAASPLVSEFYQRFAMKLSERSSLRIPSNPPVATAAAPADDVFNNTASTARPLLSTTSLLPAPRRVPRSLTRATSSIERGSRPRPRSLNRAPSSASSAPLTSASSACALPGGMDIRYKNAITQITICKCVSHTPSA